MKFKCDCENIRIAEKRVIKNAIKRGHILSCNIDKCHPRYLDLDGQKFGKLLVLKSDLPDRKVLAKCDCGKEIEVDKTSVSTGHTRSCGIGFCHPNTRDLTGQRFGYLVAQKMVGSRVDGYKNTMWECLCECGKVFTTLGHSLLTDNTKSCGCETGVLCSQKTRLPNNQQIINEIFASYKLHAKKLQVEFLLSREEFEKLISSLCHYCGGDLSNMRKLKKLTGATEFRYNGIDRMDTVSDYKLENCVAACKDCNYAKRKISYDEFIDLAKRIASRF